MIEYLVDFLQTNVLPWGAVGVFAASVVEEIIAPLPSALVMTTAGFLLVSGPVTFGSVLTLIFKVALPGAVGVTLGSYLVYFVARYGGRFIIDKWGKYAGLYWSDVEKLKARMSGTRKDEVFIGIARAIPFIPSTAVSALCGILEINILRYFIITFIGVFVRAMILGVVGWQAGNVYQKYAETISSVEDIILVSTVLAVVVFIVVKYNRRKKEK